MKVFLLKDVENIGMAGEIIKVSEGHALNYLLPKKLALAVTAENEKDFLKRAKALENRKQVIASKTSMLAEKIKTMKFVMKRKMHEDKLYGSINPSEIVDLLAQEGIKVSKNQIIFEKPIKTQGLHEVTIKLSNQLQPKLNIKIVADNN